jgi:DNA-binding protein HU-beta
LDRLPLFIIHRAGCRNPQTGKEIKIPAKKVVKFSAGKALKQKAK